MSRPAVISAQKVDAIIGNPPWLTYSRSAGIIRSELEGLSKSQYQIWAGGRNSPHQDIASLFFCRAMELYLRPAGLIGMVLPHSALRSGQHLKWRSGYYEAKRPPRSQQEKRAISANFGIKHPWDLSVLEPRDFFPIASCVVFASFTGNWGDVEDHKKAAKPLAPGKVEVWWGDPGTPSVDRAVTNLIHDDGTFRSPYANLSSQGPTIVDRRLFFVTSYPNDNPFLALPNIRKTYPAIGSQDKKKYSVRELQESVVSEDNIFDVCLGETVGPYVTLPPRTAVLPVSKESMTIQLDHSGCELDGLGQHEGRRHCILDEQALNDGMRSRWEIMARLWDENKGGNDNKTLFQRLNYHNTLTSQLDYMRSKGRHKIRIAYTTSGRPTAALITDDKSILDTTLYQVHCVSTDEAHYLLAIINSVALEDAVDHFRPKGLFGSRHVHKHLWKLPIPKYDPGDALHTKLSRLGRSAAKSAKKRIDSLQQDDWRRLPDCH